MGQQEAPEKRGSTQALVEHESSKRPRTDASTALLPAVSAGGGMLARAGPQRTSDLLAPIMLLEGHTGAVNTCKFSPDGRHLISGSHDKLLLMWEVFGENKNVLTLRGHRNSVLQAHWLEDGEGVLSCSADKTVALWDSRTGGRSRIFKGHSSFVNSCAHARESHVIASGADDSSARLWDMRVRSCQRTLAHPFAVTAVALSSTGNQLFTGCLDGHVRVFDLRKSEKISKMLMKGHQDLITGLSLSRDDTHLLSNAMDNTVRCWDVRPYCPNERCVKVFLGAQHNYEKSLLKCNWSRAGDMVSAGSADNFVYVWDANSRRILYKLPGHAGSIIEVDFHPEQPIIASCSNDKKIYLGEIKKPAAKK